MLYNIVYSKEITSDKQFPNMMMIKVINSERKVYNIDCK